MAVIADRCSLHSRFLNESKGPAVRALRQQMDKPSYARRAVALLRAQPNLDIVRGMVDDLVVEAGAVRGVVCADGRASRAEGDSCDRHVPRRKVLPRRVSFKAEGRFGEAPAMGLSAALRRWVFRRCV